MQSLTQKLKASLKGAKKTAVLGVGSELRGDDVAGVLCAKALIKNPPKLKKNSLRVFLGQTAPENLSGQIREFKPTHLVIIDSAQLGSKPGTIKLFDPVHAGGVSFSTHRLPLKMMADYLVQEIGCKVIIMGIQPEKIDFCGPVADEVKRAAKIAAVALKKALSA